MESLTPRELAHHWASLGIPVLPVREDKKPYTRHGLKDATTDHDVIDAFWTAYPEARVGGALPPHIMVVDCDVVADKGVNGIAEWITHWGELPHTYSTSTPRGGRHLYLRVPHGLEVRNSTSQLAEGIDVRTHGGYVLLPGNPGYASNGVSFDDMAEMPGHLVQWYREQAAARAARTQRASESDASREDIEEALKYVNPDLPYDQWIAIGMALHAWSPEGGFELWDQWSEDGESYVSADDLWNHWKSFDATKGTGLGTLFHLAKEGGWGGPIPITPPSLGSRVVPAPEPEPDDEHLVVADMDQVAVRCVDWLWPNRLARGTYTCLAGPQGASKSTLCATIAACVTTGKWPDGHKSIPQRVIILNSEDDEGAVLAPRLMAAGADLSMIKLVKARKGPAGHEPITLGQNMRDVVALAERIGNVGFIYIDVLNSYLGAGVDAHRDNEVRPILEACNVAAQRLNCCVMGVAHFNKAVGRDPLNRIMGSVAYTGAARDVWICVPEGEGFVVCANAKRNIGLRSPGFRYELSSTDVEGAGSTGTIEWRELEVEDTASAILAAADAPEDERSALDEAKAWLEAALANGSRPAQRLMDEAASDGIKKATLRRAKDRMKVESKKVGMDRGWSWVLPEGYFSARNEGEI